MVLLEKLSAKLVVAIGGCCRQQRPGVDEEHSVVPESLGEQLFGLGGTTS